MFSDFSSVQAIAYRILMNGVRNNKCSHAYLINTNGYNKGFDFAKAFAKVLLCPNGSDECNCSVCASVDNDKIVNNAGFSASFISSNNADSLSGDSKDFIHKYSLIFTHDSTSFWQHNSTDL